MGLSHDQPGSPRSVWIDFYIGFVGMIPFLPVPLAWYIDRIDHTPSIVMATALVEIGAEKHVSINKSQPNNPCKPYKPKLNPINPTKATDLKLQASRPILAPG